MYGGVSPSSKGNAQVKIPSAPDVSYNTSLPTGVPLKIILLDPLPSLTTFRIVLVPNPVAVKVVDPVVGGAVAPIAGYLYTVPVVGDGGVKICVIEPVPINDKLKVAIPSKLPVSVELVM